MFRVSRSKNDLINGNSLNQKVPPQLKDFPEGTVAYPHLEHH
jgi:hypothetical protein